jgi:hypothetical protein
MARTETAPLAIYEPKFGMFKVKCPTCWRTIYHQDRDEVERCIDLHAAKCDRKGIV